MPSYDAIVIGAGHNGLTAAAYLAQAGLDVLIVERRAILGGIAATEEKFAGFKYSTCAHLAGSFSAQVIGDLRLENHGLEILQTPSSLLVPSLDGQSLLIPSNPGEARERLSRYSKKDSLQYPRYCEHLKTLSTFLLTLYGFPLPHSASNGNLNPAELIKVGWHFRRLGQNDMYDFLRILPMSAADMLNEWFETDLLKASLAGLSVLGSFVGPRQQGTAFNLLHHLIGRSNGALRTAGLIRGGIGRLAEVLARAACKYGAQVRTGIDVNKIVTRSGAATGVLLQSGEEIEAKTVLSSTDAKQTFLKLVEPIYLDPNFLLQVKNIRSRGTVAKVNLALDALPKFDHAGYREANGALGGVIHIGPTLDYLEHAADAAKYGRFSEKPFLEIVIPTVADPSLAPAGKHVMSIWMQYAPYQLKATSWNEQREALGNTVINLIEDYAPGFKNSVLHRQVLTPLDLEQIYALTGGHLYHAEPALDQIFFMRPVPGWARYHTPIKNLYLCGSAAHPGGGVTGLPGYFAAKEILRGWRRRK